ncbi:MAG: HEAT repeat domain-containing protein [Elusimicrobiota bacterium]|nr:HEAT repeat domain-containing protein [Elusimicrobiota bacterium]
MKRTIKYLLSSILLSFIFFGCAARRPFAVTEPDRGLDKEKQQRIEKILDSVSQKASRLSLENLGRSTMKESVDIIDMGTLAASHLIRKLKKARSWKMRYWLVDMLGYIQSRDGLWPLLEIIEDPTEKEEVRLRACEALKELNYSEIADNLRISAELVKDIKIKEKIIETINSIR